MKDFVEHQPHRSGEAAEGPPAQGLRALALRLSQRSRRGNVLVTFALVAPVIVLLIGGLLDISSMVTAQIRLQDATDAAALAVSTNTAKNPNVTEASLQVIAQRVLTTDFNGSGVTISDFHVCAPIQADCTTKAGVTMGNETVYMATQTQAPCYLGNILPGVCTGGNVSNPINVSTTSTIGFAMNVEMDLLLDSSASMIVGATTADVEAVEAWNNVPANWNTVRYANETGQKTPCAFACHDDGYNTGNQTASDIQLGLTRAASAGATTRFAVVISAAYGLVQHLQSEVSNSQQLSRNTYYFNVADFNDSATIDYTSAANDFSGTEKSLCSTAPPNSTTPPPFTPACSSVKVGIDTHINELLPSVASAMGSSGTGTGTSRLKFLIIATDGLESDFNKDFSGCTGYTSDTAWMASDQYSPWYKNNAYGASGRILTGCYATTLNTTACSTMKTNGIVVAVLETPYVRLDRDPSLAWNGQNASYFPMDTSELLYESYVRHTIFPGGDGTPSTVSAALQNCASSPAYYFQANSPADIATGFTTLADRFLANMNYLSK